jgi:hypothetical protein
MPQWGMLLLAIWLIVTGLMALLQINFAYSAIVLPLLAVAAGILLLVRS